MIPSLTKICHHQKPPTILAYGIVLGVDGELTFDVHIKLNQWIKDLNAGSSHTPYYFQAIHNGVHHHLTKLTTTVTDSNTNSAQLVG